MENNSPKRQLLGTTQDGEPKPICSGCDGTPKAMAECLLTSLALGDATRGVNQVSFDTRHILSSAMKDCAGKGLGNLDLRLGSLENFQMVEK